MSTREIISPGLLARMENLVTSKPTPQQFSLGMSDLTDDNNDKENADFHPPKMKTRKDLSRKVTAKDRFAESISELLNYIVHTPQSIMLCDVWLPSPRLLHEFC